MLMDAIRIDGKVYHPVCINLDRQVDAADGNGELEWQSTPVGDRVEQSSEQKLPDPNLLLQQLLNGGFQLPK